METIHAAIENAEPAGTQTFLRATRETLAKRRWRGVADDGQEFGFDLDHPIEEGDVFAIRDGKQYVITQLPEKVLELRISDGSRRIEDVARMGWLLGNLHFPIEIGEGIIRVIDDPAIRQALAREGFAFEEVERVFHPLKTSAHGHH